MNMLNILARGARGAKETFTVNTYINKLKRRVQSIILTNLDLNTYLNNVL